MPAIYSKEPVLDGRAELVVFSRDTSVYFLRVYDSSRRAYRTQKLTAAVSITDARDMALEAYIGLSQLQPDGSLGKKPKRGSPVGSTKKKRQLIVDLMEEWHKGFVEQHRVGLIRDATLRNRLFNMKGLTLYLNYAQLTYIDQIKVGCFDSYQIFRASYSIWTWKRELTHLKEFLVHLVTIGQLDASLLINKKLIPEVRPKDSDYDANPPFRDSDLALIWKDIHRWVKDAEHSLNGRHLHARRRAWTFFAFLRASGCRPGEALQVKWSDIEFENVKRFSESLFMETMQSLSESNSEINIEEIKALPVDNRERMSFGMKDDVVSHVRVLHTKTHRAREVSCRAATRLLAWKKWQEEELVKQGSRLTLSPDTFVFAIPDHNEWRLLATSTYIEHWRHCMKRLKGKLKGAELTERRYTPYSFRSYRAMELKKMGVDPLLAADQLGHDVGIMQKIYARLPARERATREAASFNYGQRRITPEILQFDIDY